MPRHKNKRDGWDVLLILIVVVSTAFIIIQPRLEANIVQHRDLLDFNSDDDAPTDFTAESTTFDEQQKLGVLNVIEQVSFWTFGALVVAYVIGNITKKAKK